MHPKTGRTFCDSPCFFLVGIVVGFLIADAAISPRFFCPDRIRKSQDSGKPATPQLPFHTDQNLAVIGVMTSRDFLTTRALSVHHTWGKRFPGKVIFFAPENAADVATRLPEIEVVILKDVDDVYPPLKKSYMMLKYLHDRYVDSYRFFLRVDDDSFIKGDELVRFLHSVAADHLVIGNPGWGEPQHIAILGLQKDENFCQGGPGVIVPREVMRRAGPKIKLCLKTCYSVHDDVEFGRCFKHHANASCTVAYDVPFYQNYRDYKGCFNHSLVEDDGIIEAIILHPLKVPSYTYRMYQYFRTLEAKKVYSRLQVAMRDVRAMNNLLLAKPRARFLDILDRYACSSSSSRRSAVDICPWVFISGGRYSPYVSNPRLRKLPNEIVAENATLKQIFAVISRLQNLGREVKRKDIELLYSRLGQLQGFDYIFKVQKTIWNKHTRDAKKFSQFYAHRPFLPTEMTEESKLNVASESENGITVGNVDKIRVNIIITLVGRYQTFLNFMKTFEDRFLKKKQNISLLLVVFRDTRDDTSAKVISDIDALGRKYDGTPLSTVLLEGGFSREKALRAGVQRFKDDDLLFLADVEVDFDASTLQRIRLNTKLGDRVYMPISFGEYDPNSLPETVGSFRKKRSASEFDAEAGHWRSYSFQTVSCYKLDLLRTGEESDDSSDIVEKFLASDINIFRSADVGLKQRYKPGPCKTSINNTQYETCFDKIASTETLAEYVYRKSAILNRVRSTR